jgi:hypothetical protein
MVSFFYVLKVMDQVQECTWYKKSADKKRPRSPQGIEVFPLLLTKQLRDALNQRVHTHIRHGHDD